MVTGGVAGTLLPYLKLNSAALAPVGNRPTAGAATIAAADLISTRRVSFMENSLPFRPQSANRCRLFCSTLWNVYSCFTEHCRKPILLVKPPGQSAAKDKSPTMNIEQRETDEPSVK